MLAWRQALQVQRDADAVRRRSKSRGADRLSLRILQVDFGRLLRECWAGKSGYRVRFRSVLVLICSSAWLAQTSLPSLHPLRLALSAAISLLHFAAGPVPNPASRRPTAPTDQFNVFLSNQPRGKTTQKLNLK